MTHSAPDSVPEPDAVPDLDAVPKPSNPKPSNNADAQPPTPSDRPLANHLTVGELGEVLVAEWIATQGGQLLTQRWHCRRGELDLVALFPETTLAQTPGGKILAFIEVKTRSRGNWDLDGLLAITPSKQRKLWHCARLYLAQHSCYGALPCRFDVALVRSQRSPQFRQTDKSLQTRPTPTPVLGQPVVRGDYRLTIQHYLSDAFRLD